jgi:fructose-bisphosphate aldolase class II
VPLVSALPLLQAARDGRHAVGAFNAQNLEFVQGILAAAEALDSPVILQLSARTIQYGGMATLTAMARAAAQEARVPVALHLDMAGFEMNVRALAAGFTSVMVAGSNQPFAMHVEETHRVVEVAHALQVPVEGEFGLLGEPGRDLQTARRLDPDLVRKFVTLSGVDALAVPPARIQSSPDAAPHLDRDRLRAIVDTCGVPIVLHHASQLEDTELSVAIAVGVAKVAIGTELMAAFTRAVREASLRDPDEIDPRVLLAAGRSAIRDLVSSRIRLFGSAGKATLAGMKILA